MIHKHNAPLDSNACGVYYIRDETTVYIGKTTRSFAIRWQEHIIDLENGNHSNYKLQKSYDAGNVLVCGVLVELKTSEIISKAEETLIQYYAKRVPVFNLEGVTQHKY